MVAVELVGFLYLGLRRSGLASFRGKVQECSGNGGDVGVVWNEALEMVRDAGAGYRPRFK